MTQDYRGRWALVTGASAGIGEEFARQLAEAGANIVVVARREARLEQLTAFIRSHGQQAIAIRADLAEEGAPERIVKQLEEQGIRIDILVNNAGFGLTGTYAASEWQDQRKFIELMVTSYAHLAHLVLPGMMERRYGRIINVASVAGLVPPAAGHTLYGPTKSFLVSFSQALAAEGKPHGVHSSALCPGFTYTEFHDVTETRDRMDKLPGFLMMQVEPTVRGALKAVEKDRTVYVPGWQYKFLVWLSNILPRSWVEEMVKGPSSAARNIE